MRKNPMREQLSLFYTQPSAAAEETGGMPNLPRDNHHINV
jgi:hypothetical protein